MVKGELETEQPAFASWRSYHSFAREVARNRRYFLSTESKAFLEAVAATCCRREETVPAGWIGWRAQLGHDWRLEPQIGEDVEFPYPPGRMRPLTDKAHEGRVNSKGIPCLYLANKKDTAMSEVRPWIGSFISLASFEVKEEIKIVDCTRHNRKRAFIFFNEPPPEKREEAVWQSINEAFAQPVTRADDHADYAPTQILAEYFRNIGYGGVAYKSAFGEDGFNLALFNVNTAEMLHCSLHKVENLNFHFTNQNEEYYTKFASERSKRKRSRKKTAEGERG